MILNRSRLGYNMILNRSRRLQYDTQQEQEVTIWYSTGAG